MDIPSLIELVKSYKDNKEVTAKIFLKDGRTELVKNIIFSGKELTMGDGKPISNHEISHAEIFAI